MSLRHRIAVLVGHVRKPGRFSIRRYPREKALARLAADSRQGHVLDVGCGSRRLDARVIAVDLTPAAAADVVADATCLPFPAASCEGVWLEALLEHVPDPDRVLAEAARVLKPGGWIYCEVPFLQGEHDAPGDYRRWTRQGLVQLFGGFEVEWIEPAAGPFSALAYQLRACLAVATSFGSDLAWRVLFEALWGYVVWPIARLDALFRHHPRAQAHAFGWALMARRR